MKTYILAGFLLLAAGVAVYIVTSLRSVAGEKIKKEDLPQGTYEIVQWTSDANGVAYILIDPSKQMPVRVSEGLGRKESEGFRSSHEYLNAVAGKTQVQRLVNRKDGETLAFILASAGLEIETGFNVLKRSVIVLIRDPEDSHHQKSREGP